MSAQIIGAVLVTAAVCAAAAFAALMCQTANHGDDRAGQASVLVQAADDGDPLECWEWDEMDRIERLYADNADEPAQRPGGTP